MTVYRCTVFAGQATDGLSETYYTPDTSSSLGANLMSKVLSLRGAMMPTRSYFQGMRVSQYGALRSSQLLIPPGGNFADSGVAVSIPANGTFPDTSLINYPNQFRAAVQLRLAFDNTRRSTRYISMAPASVMGTEPATWFPAGDPLWVNALNQFTAFLVANAFQVACLDLSAANPTYQVVKLVTGTQTQPLLGIVISNTLTPSFPTGTKILTHAFRPAKGTRGSTLNGNWLVDSSDTTTVPGFLTIYLQNSTGILPSSQRITAKTTIRKEVFVTKAIQGIEVIRVGIHKRGKPSLAPRGRRLAVKSLDP